MVPSATVVGAPRLLLAEPPATLLSDDTLSVPELIVTRVVKVLSPERIQVPVPSTARLMLLPLIFPAISPVFPNELSTSDLGTAPLTAKSAFSLSSPAPA